MYLYICGIGDDVRLIICGIEYSGTTTLATGISAWAGSTIGGEFPVHDHWKFPDIECYRSGPSPSLSDTDRQTMLGLSSKLKEMLQRQSLVMHFGDAGEFTDQILAGFHLDDTVYGPLYFDYGGLDEPQGGPRARYARYVEEQFLKRAPETVFVYLKASAKVIKKRMHDEQRHYGVLKPDDIDAVLEAFETQAEASLFAKKIELDTSDSTPAETLDQLIAQLQPFFTDTDRMRMLAHKALAVGGNQ
jgi:hypothetical protein